jgi:hypothetical protein
LDLGGGGEGDRGDARISALVGWHKDRARRGCDGSRRRTARDEIGGRGVRRKNTSRAQGPFNTVFFKVPCSLHDHDENHVWIFDPRPNRGPFNISLIDE